MVGPVRSVRKTDQSIVWPIGGIFAYSGGARVRDRQHRHRAGEQLDETRAGPMMFRDPRARSTRRSTSSRTSTRCTRPAASRSRRRRCSATASRARTSAATPVASFVVGFAGGFAPTWTLGRRRAAPGCARPVPAAASAYDATGTSVRAEERRRDVRVSTSAASGVSSSPKRASPARAPRGCSPTARSSRARGRGPTRSKPAKLLDAKGTAIPLTPGQTWVELPDVSYTVTVTAGSATATRT